MSSSPVHLPRTSTLPNGIHIVSRQRLGGRVLAFNLAVRAGARYETLDTPSAARFLERVLLAGTERWPSRDLLLRSISARGGTLSTTAGREAVELRVAVGQDDLDLALAVLRDILLASRFDSTTLEAERIIIRNQVVARQDAPEQLASDLLFDTVFAGHPLGIRPTGTVEGIGSISLDGLRAYWTEHLAGPNVIVGAVGGLDHDALVERLGRAFADLPSGPVTPANTTPMPMSLGREVSVAAGQDQAHIFVGVPLLGVAAEGRAALRVANAVLTRLSGRLYVNIRDRRGLAYSTYSSVAQYSDGGILFAHVGTAPANVDEVRRLLVEELTRLREERLTARELDNARGAEVGARILGRERSVDEATALTRDALFGLPPAEVQDDQLRAVTADDVQTVARTYLDAERMSIVVAGPGQTASEEEGEA